MKPVKIGIPGYMGVNLLDNATLLRPEELLLAKNLAFSPGSGLAKRQGLGNYANIHVVTQWSAFHIPPYECTPLGFAVGKQPDHDLVITITNDKDYPTITAEYIEITNAYDGRPMFVTFQNVTYCFIGRPYTHAAVKLEKAAGITLSGMTLTEWDLSGVGNKFAPKVACAYRDRMAYFNLGTGYENAGVFSDDLTPGIVGDNASTVRQFLFGGRDGDYIVAAVEIQLVDSGTPASSALLVLRNHSAYMMKGEPAQTTDVGSYFGDAEISKINKNCGCASAQTVVTTPYGVIWAGPDDVWLMPTGQVPIAVGTKIRQRLLATPPSQRFLWSAVYKDGVYRLSICSPGQGPTSSFDPCGEQWWLDLRDGIPSTFRQARWFGPQIYTTSSSDGATAFVGTHMQVSDTRQGRTNDIYSIESVNGGAAGVMVNYDVNQAYDLSQQVAIDMLVTPGNLVRAANVVTITTAIANDLATGDSIVLDNVNSLTIETNIAPGTYVITVTSDTQFHFASVGANFTNVLTHSFRKLSTLSTSEIYGTEITTELDSKVYDLENPMTDKTLAGVQVNAEVSEAVSLIATGIVDRGRIIETMVDTLPSTGLRAQVGALDSNLLTDEFSAVGLFPAPSSRPNGKSHQIKISDSAGYVVEAGLNEFRFFHDSTVFLATLTIGYYSTFETFMNQLITAMNAVDPTWSHNQATGSRFTLATLKRNLTNIEASGPIFLFKDNGSQNAVLGLTAAQLLSNRQLGALIGLNTSTDLAAEVDPTDNTFKITAINAVPWKRSAAIEYNGINLKLSPQKREPV